jgi:CheY-like chemotaxis protein
MPLHNGTADPGTYIYYVCVCLVLLFVLYVRDRVTGTSGRGQGAGWLYLLTGMLMATDIAGTLVGSGRPAYAGLEDPVRSLWNTLFMFSAFAWFLICNARLTSVRIRDRRLIVLSSLPAAAAALMSADPVLSGPAGGTGATVFLVSGTAAICYYSAAMAMSLADSVSVKGEGERYSLATFFVPVPLLLSAVLQMLYGIGPIYIGSVTAIAMYDIEYLRQSRGSEAKLRDLNRQLADDKRRLTAFAEMFSSAYIIHLRRGMYEVVRANEGLGTVVRKGGGRKELEAFVERHVHPDDRDKIRDLSAITAIIRRLRSQKVITFTFREIFGERERLMRGCITYFEEPDCIALGFTDITDALTEENGLRKKLQRALDAKTNYMVTMSHAVRTAAEAATGYARMAGKLCADGTGAQAAIGRAVEAGDCLRGLLGGIINTELIESGGFAAEVSITDIAELNRRLADLFEGEAARAGVRFVSDASNVSDRYVLTDGRMVMRLVSCLISNAIRYTPRGGEVSHTVRQLPSDRAGTGVYEITVRDSGVGMSREFQAGVFDGFSSAGGYDGAGPSPGGLGLSIAGRLAERLGARFEIFSEEGAGTSATVTLKPFLCTEHEIGEYTDSLGRCGASASLEGRRVLLADDNMLSLELTSEMLSGFGMSVSTASNGKEAVDALEAAGPGFFDVVVMDIQMPVMDGCEAAGRIRMLDEPSLSCIPIVALSAGAFSEDRGRALDSGIDDYVVKPVDPQRLREAIAARI